MLTEIGCSSKQFFLIFLEAVSFSWQKVNSWFHSQHNNPQKMAESDLFQDVVWNDQAFTWFPAGIYFLNDFNSLL